VRQQNFFDFINRFRIDEAKLMLTNPKDRKITVLEVLYQVGFNSKSSFNTLFKKYTGLTPTAFRKEQQKEPLHPPPPKVEPNKKRSTLCIRSTGIPRQGNLAP